MYLTLCSLVPSIINTDGAASGIWLNQRRLTGVPYRRITLTDQAAKPKVTICGEMPPDDFWSAVSSALTSKTVIGIGIIDLSASPAAWATIALVSPFKSNGPPADQFKLTALATSTPDLAKAAAKAHGVPLEEAYSSLEDIANDPDVDMVVVPVQVKELVSSEWIISGEKGALKMEAPGFAVQISHTKTLLGGGAGRWRRERDLR
ncbi:MAG: hypothetical protein LQ343_001903 [Gyalolechia ehrenbergii]|nr:MAG: hypothetical protein LQ343_001903 [Gyalolechia ehrenbergii]